MDDQLFHDKLATWRCQSVSRLNYWRLTKKGQTTLVCEGSESVGKILQSLTDDVRDKPDQIPYTTSFTLLSSSGDPCPEREQRAQKLHMSHGDFMSLISACRFPRHIVLAFGLRHPHISYHIHYSEETAEPVAISIILRAPRNNAVILCAMRIRLIDRTTVCFVSSVREDIMESIRQLCIRQAEKLVSRPEHLIAFIFQLRMVTYEAYLSELWAEVNELETATEMTRRQYKSQLAPERAIHLSDHGNLLVTLHAAHEGLSYCKTVYAFADRFGKTSLEIVGLVENLRLERGQPPSEKHIQSVLKEEIKLTMDMCDSQRDKMQELIENLRAQINVTFSLVAQRDSKINLAVAEDSNRVAGLAARDSQTMKTITVLTLVFLPSTLVTSIWSADIFHLDDDLNWRVYTAVTIGLTTLVLCIWLVYMRAFGYKANVGSLHIAGVGYVREGRIVSRMDSGTGVGR